MKELAKKVVGFADEECKCYNCDNELRKGEIFFSLSIASGFSLHAICLYCMAEYVLSKAAQSERFISWWETVDWKGRLFPDIEIVDSLTKQVGSLTEEKQNLEKTARTLTAALNARNEELKGLLDQKEIMRNQLELVRKRAQDLRSQLKLARLKAKARKRKIKLLKVKNDGT